MVATVSTLVGVVAILAGVVMLIFFLLHRFTDNLQDPLLVKNLTFFFGPSLINIAMYHGIAVLHAVFPQYSGHAWKTAVPMVIGWNLVLLFVLLAYFHHLYMDFAQPRAVQLIGQIASYGTSIPAAVVTVLGTLAQVYRRSVRWTIASTLIFLGTMGWAIGGTAAVIDSTVAVNFRFHNTLWVPAHFHTDLLVGLIFILLGFVAHLTQSLSGVSKRVRLARTAIPLLLMGGYGFVFIFYKGFLCNWMVSLASVLGLTSKDTLGKVVVMWLPIFAFFALGFEHSVVNLFVIPAGILMGAKTTIADWWLWNQIPVTLGNILGAWLLTATALYWTYFPTGEVSSLQTGATQNYMQEDKR